MDGARLTGGREDGEPPGHRLPEHLGWILKVLSAPMSSMKVVGDPLVGPLQSDTSEVHPESSLRLREEHSSTQSERESLGDNARSVAAAFRAEHLQKIYDLSCLVRSVVSSHPSVLESLCALDAERGPQPLPKRRELIDAFAATKDLWESRGAPGWDRDYAVQLNHNRELVWTCLETLPEYKSRGYHFLFSLERDAAAIDEEHLSISALRSRSERRQQTAALEDRLRLPLGLIERDTLVVRETLAERDKSIAIMVESNLPLVHLVANEYLRGGRASPRWDDVVQCGSIGLMHALLRFDPHTGNQFSTYAVPWIRQGIRREIHDSFIHIPAYRRGDIAQIRSTEEALTQEFGRRPVDEEIAAALKVDLSDVQEVTPRLRSIHIPVSGSGEERTIDIVDEAESRATPELPGVGGEELLEIVQRVFSEDARSHRIVVRRFGLDGQPAATLQELGGELQLTRERVRQLEIEALQTLRDFFVVREAPVRERETQAAATLNRRSQAIVRSLFTKTDAPFSELGVVDERGRTPSKKDVERALHYLAKALKS